MWEAAGRSIPDLPGRIAAGEFGPLLEWLRRSVHDHGRRYPAAELCRRVTGGPLGHGSLMLHLNSKLRPLHGLD
jgi:carboxypeptidase Taq